MSNNKTIIVGLTGGQGSGKSTISNNIATSIADMGFKVGLMDADIMGLANQKCLD